VRDTMLDTMEVR